MIGTPSAPATFAELDSQAGSLLQSALGSGTTPLADMATTPGSASYRGVLALGAPLGAILPPDVFANPDLLGALSMEANFANDSITGRAENFRTAGGTAVGGALDITGGTIIGTGFNASLGGMLERNGMPAGYAGTLDGAFYGPAADSLVGRVTGSVQSGPGIPDVVYGAVVAD